MPYEYEYEIGEIVVVKEKAYLLEAKIAARMNGLYLLTFANAHHELVTVTWPYCGKVVERAMYARPEQIQRMQIHQR